MKPVTDDAPVGIVNMRSLTSGALQGAMSTHVGNDSGRRTPDTQVTILPLDGIFPSLQASIHAESPDLESVPSTAVGMSQPGMWCRCNIDVVVVVVVEVAAVVVRLDASDARKVVVLLQQGADVLPLMVAVAVAIRVVLVVL